MGKGLGEPGSMSSQAFVCIRNHMYRHKAIDCSTLGHKMEFC
jgi:hypothetical protein